jgi:predicted AAA+ superfamily ATPase
MILAEIEEIARTERVRLDSQDLGLERDILPDLPAIPGFALDISGIRRCGKSTLLHQYVERRGEPYFYFNFDDIRLANFSIDDYRYLDKCIDASRGKLLFFDEVQQAPLWERYVRQKLDENYNVCVTGSNASLLSAEFGTHLTGRHLSKQLYPFTYNEYCRFTKQEFSKKSLESYLISGGFPEYLKTQADIVLAQIQNDIIYRDIITRYGIRDTASFLQLYTYLVSNQAQLVSTARLKIITQIKSSKTMLDYISYFENAYLLKRLPMFSWSLRSSLASPKKVYILDSGIIRTASASFSENRGALLENLVFNLLNQKTSDLYYYKDKNTGSECDFIVNPNKKPVQCIQVCYDYNTDNYHREVKGLLAAMDFFDVNRGTILTLDGEDMGIENGKEIAVTPVWKWKGGD